MKIIVWNVNGIRAIIKKNNLIELINCENPDIFCIGETKINNNLENIQNDINLKLLNKYYYYWNTCVGKKGYSGTAIYTKKKPINIIYGLNVDLNEYDEEGRVITCEFKKFYLVHVYTPNSGQLLVRLNYRVNTWDEMFKKYIINLETIKPVIVCGDLNVAHHEIDLKNYKTNLRTAGFTIEERNSFDKLLNETTLIDSFRLLNPLEIKYSYWSYKFQSRIKNNGWRIDYFLISKILQDKIKKSDILVDVLGSDHAPIILKIKL